MLNENYRITPLDGANCNVSWTTPWPEGASWLFVNGKHARGPYVTGETERTIKIPFALEDTAKLEIHDFPDAETQADPVEVRPNTRPLLIWNAVAEAVRYRIYHRAFGDVGETLIYDKPRIEDAERYEITCPVKLAGRGGIWHFLRVEAVDLYGNESTRQSWTYFVMDLPPAPATVEVAAGSGPGLYTISLED
jgi:hypothetical protein